MRTSLRKGLLGLGALVAGWVLVDLLVTTQRERLQALVNSGERALEARDVDAVCALLHSRFTTDEQLGPLRFAGNSVEAMRAPLADAFARCTGLRVDVEVLTFLDDAPPGDDPGAPALPRAQAAGFARVDLREGAVPLRFRCLLVFEQEFDSEWKIRAVHDLDLDWGAF